AAVPLRGVRRDLLADEVARRVANRALLVRQPPHAAEHSTASVTIAAAMAVHIGVVGQSVCSRTTARTAERGGGAIPRAGPALFSRGAQHGGGGVAAGASGAARAGGEVVGVLPGFSRRDANRWVTIPVVTGMDQARNVVLVRSCDAVIAIGGSYGTLSEIALALKLGVPVVGLRTWKLAPPEARRVPLLRAGDADDAVRLALRAARRDARRRTRTWLS